MRLAVVLVWRWCLCLHWGNRLYRWLRLSLSYSSVCHWSGLWVGWYCCWAINSWVAKAIVPLIFTHAKYDHPYYGQEDCTYSHACTILHLEVDVVERN